MTSPSDPLPADLAAAHAMILAPRELLTLAKREVTVGRLEIERLKLMLAKARREQYGQSSECGRLLVEQLELAIEDLEKPRPSRKQRPRSRRQQPLRRGRQCGHEHVLRCTRNEDDARNTDANDNEPRPPAQHGQNDPEMAIGRKNWTFAGSDVALIVQPPSIR